MGQIWVNLDIPDRFGGYILRKKTGEKTQNNFDYSISTFIMTYTTLEYHALIKDIEIDLLLKNVHHFTIKINVNLSNISRQEMPIIRISRTGGLAF